MAYKKATKKQEVSFDVKEHICVLGTNKSTNWTLECNLISWNRRPPKYDIRAWSEKHEHMSKGITLTPQEMMTLVESMEGRL